MVSINEYKNTLRQRILELRSNLSEQEINDKSQKIIKTLATFPEFSNSKLIMCYVDFRNEVVTKGFITDCLKEGRRVAVPFIFKKDGSKEMLASEIFNIDDLRQGAFGLLEPSINSMIEVDPKELELIIVPGVVFDYSKNRIGYGAGYYDRFLKKVNKNCYKVGVAFDIQFVNEVLAEEHDIKLDAIITESTVVF